MSSAKKLDHEEFRIEQGRFNVVRESRLEPEMPCFFRIGGDKYRVLDYSTFGLSILMEQPTSIEYVEKCTFSFGQLDIPGLTVRKSYFHENPTGGYKCGVEIVEGEIDIDMINAYQTAIDVIEQARQSIIGDVSVPVEFQVKTLAIKSKFTEIAGIVNDAGKELLSHTSAEKNIYLEKVFAEFFSSFLHDTIVFALDDLKQTIDHVDRETQLKALQFFRTELGEVIFAAPFVDRIAKKPYGYAGDFEMMNQIYNNDMLGETLFARCFNKAFLEAPASKAVRNRSEYLYGKLVSEVESRPGQVVKILSVASGPAREIQLILERSPHLADRLQIDLLDQDLRSLKMAKVSLLRLARKAGVELKINYVNLAIKNVLENKLSTGPYDMIYSAGLFDYFSDAVARLAGAALYRHVGKGGKLIIGNFNITNPSRFIMECGGDWHLVHRSVDEMKALFCPIAPNTIIESESENINLFAVMER